MRAVQRLPHSNRRQQQELRLNEGHGRGEASLVQQDVLADGIPEGVVAIVWLVVTIVMRMAVIRLQGSRVFQAVQLTQGAEHRLQQHANRHQNQQGGVEKTAVAAKALHGRARGYRQAAYAANQPDKRPQTHP